MCFLIFLLFLEEQQRKKRGTTRKEERKQSKDSKMPDICVKGLGGLPSVLFVFQFIVQATVGVTSACTIVL